MRGLSGAFVMAAVLLAGQDRLCAQDPWNRLVEAVAAREEWVRGNALSYLELHANRSSSRPFYGAFVSFIGEGSKEKWVRYSASLQGASQEQFQATFIDWNQGSLIDLETRLLQAQPQIAIISNGRTLILTHDSARLWAGELHKGIEPFARRGGLIGSFLFGEQWLSAALRVWKPYKQEVVGGLMVFDLRADPDQMFTIRMYVNQGEGQRIERMEYWAPHPSQPAACLESSQLGCLQIKLAVSKFTAVGHLQFPADMDLQTSYGAVGGNHAKLWVRYTPQTARDPETFSLDALPAEIASLQGAAVVRDRLTLESYAIGAAPGIEAMLRSYQSPPPSDSKETESNSMQSWGYVSAVVVGAALIWGLARFLSKAT